MAGHSEDNALNVLKETKLLLGWVDGLDCAASLQMQGVILGRFQQCPKVTISPNIWLRAGPQAVQEVNLPCVLKPFPLRDEWLQKCSFIG